MQAILKLQNDGDWAVREPGGYVEVFSTKLDAISFIQSEGWNLVVPNNLIDRL